MAQSTEQAASKIKGAMDKVGGIVKDIFVESLL